MVALLSPELFHSVIGQKDDYQLLRNSSEDNPQNVQVAASPALFIILPISAIVCVAILIVLVFFLFRRRGFFFPKHGNLQLQADHTLAHGQVCGTSFMGIQTSPQFQSGHAGEQ